jgi:hypothetical protein
MSRNAFFAALEHSPGLIKIADLGIMWVYLSRKNENKREVV